MIKNFNIITLDTTISVIKVEKIDNERIKVSTYYKFNDFKPYVETMTIENSVFPAWFKLNERDLIIE